MQSRYRGDQESVHSNLSFYRHLTLPVRQGKNPDAVIDTSRLLFKPLSLPQIPQTSPLSPMPQLHTSASAIGFGQSAAEWDIADMLTQRLGGVVPYVQPQTVSVPTDTLSPPWGSHVSSASIAPHGRPEMLTLAHSQSHQSKYRPGSVRELVYYILSAGAVVTLYLVIPLMTTLLPVLPNGWSRLLIALETLGVGEFVICRILLKTTKK